MINRLMRLQEVKRRFQHDSSPVSTYPTCSWNKSASGWTWHQVGKLGNWDHPSGPNTPAGQNWERMILIHSDVMIGGLVTSTSTLASAQLHQTYQLTTKDLSNPFFGRPTPPSRKKTRQKPSHHLDCRGVFLQGQPGWVKGCLVES